MAAPAPSQRTPLQLSADRSGTVAQLIALQGRANGPAIAQLEGKYLGPKNGNHIHEYGGGFHIKIAGIRYNIVQNGRRKDQAEITAAFDAARTAGEDILIARMRDLLRNSYPN